MIQTTQELSSEFPFNEDMSSGNPLGIGSSQKRCNAVVPVMLTSMVFRLDAGHIRGRGARERVRGVPPARAGSQQPGCARRHHRHEAHPDRNGGRRARVPRRAVRAIQQWYVIFPWIGRGGRADTSFHEQQANLRSTQPKKSSSPPGPSTRPSCSCSPASGPPKP